MELKKAKELTATIMKVGVGKIYIDPKQTLKVKEAMTKEDLRGLIAERIIKKRQDNYQSTGRSKILKSQKQKGRKNGPGKRKGTKKARIGKKETWIKKVRAQRRTLKELKVTNPEEVKVFGYSKLYKQVKGGLFKGKKYLTEHIVGGKK
ncbi:MAG: 50S ribosomal protein L19e [archaeon]